MFQLFKERNFSDYINDTFGFFKTCGKHFFKLYFIINGSLLLIATALIYFLTKIYFEFLSSSLSGTGMNQDYMGDYFSTNAGLFFSVMIGAVLLMLLITILQYAFPVVYLDLYDARKGKGFEVKDVLNALKKRGWKIIKFVIGGIFIIFPVLCIVMGLNVLLCFLIIGFPLFLLTVPALMSWINLSFYYYMNSEESFFSALGDAFETIKGQFWPIVFSTLVTFVIYYVISTVITMIPYFIGIASMFTTLENGNPEESFSSLGIMMAAVMVISTLSSFILNNLILINQGMIYYSHIENEASSVSNNSIDLIGTERE